jgi:hypothetical protein
MNVMRSIMSFLLTIDETTSSSMFVTFPTHVDVVMKINDYFSRIPAGIL